jgi:hypothetical protein
MFLTSAPVPGLEFRGHHTHLACSFLGTELCNSLGSGERLTRVDVVGLWVSRKPLTARSITPTESTRQFTPAGVWRTGQARHHRLGQTRE